MTITVQREDATSMATMTCDECGSIAQFDPTLPYVKQALTFRSWHLGHSNCTRDLPRVDVPRPRGDPR